MKAKLQYLLLLACTAWQANAQIATLPLHMGQCLRFKQQLYAYGYDATQEKAVLCVYKLSPQFVRSDSLRLPLGKITVKQLLPPNADTLHDFLSVSVQQKESPTLSIFRISTNFSLIAQISGVEAARLNNRVLFDRESYYREKEVYSIKTARDSSGLQFYLNKYSLQSEQRNYDYTQVWQHAFERKNIRSAKVVFANRERVFVYVHIVGGPKTGAWLLMLDAAKGQLLKGKRITEAGEAMTAFYGCSRYDANQKTLELCGSKFTVAQYDAVTGQLRTAGATQLRLFYTRLDSMLDIESKADFVLPVNDVISGAKKSVGAYLLQPLRLHKTSPLSLEVDCDVYRGTGTQPCYNYVNTLSLSITLMEETPKLAKTVVSNNGLIESFYSTRDPLDMNGKLCGDSIGEVESMLRRKPTFAVKEIYRCDENKNPLWVLSKVLSKQNKVQYSFLMPVNKVYALKVLEEIPKDQQPALLNLGERVFLIQRQTEETKFEVKGYSW